MMIKIRTKVGNETVVISVTDVRIFPGTKTPDEIIVFQSPGSSEILVRSLYGALRVMPQTNNGITLKCQSWPDAEDMAPITVKSRKLSSARFKAEQASHRKGKKSRGT